MAGRFQSIRVHHLHNIRNLSLLHTAKRRNQLEHDVVFVSHIFRFVSAHIRQMETMKTFNELNAFCCLTVNS